MLEQPGALNDSSIHPTSHPDQGYNRVSPAAQIIRAIPLQPFIESGTHSSMDAVRSKIEERAKKIEAAERVILTGDTGLAYRHNWMDISNAIRFGSTVQPEMLAGYTNRLGRTLMREIYNAFGDPTDLRETNFDPSSSITDILKKLGRTVDLQTNGYQNENGALVNLSLENSRWESITLYDRLPKAEILTSPSGERWALSRTTQIVSQPITKDVHYGLAYVRLPRQSQ